MGAGIARRAVSACAFGLALLAAPSSFGGDRLIIDRVEVPAGRLGEVFPAGTELSVMDREAFDRLADDAAKAIATNDAGAPGRAAHLLRAEHSARWTAGRLTGTSVLLARGDPAAETWLDLSPWTPSAIGPGDEPSAPSESRLRTDREGRVGLWLDRSGAEVRVEIAWEQAARPGSGGRAFRLGLPRCAIASIALDLPSDLTPEGWAGLTLDDPGPSPDDPRGDRRMWRRDGPIGAKPVELRLIAAGDAERASLWVGGPTLIDAGESEARVTATWTVERPAGAPDRLVIELPAGLVPLSVDGPAVFSWGEMAQAGPGPGRVEVRLRENARDASSVTLRALARAPEKGAWSLPWARPIDAVWMGGRVVVRSVATSREIRAVENAKGRSVPARPDELEGLAPGTSVLVFDPPSAGPVADLIVGPRVPRGVAEVRGQMTLGPGRGVLEGSVSWSLDAGPLLDLGFDLPDPWVLESMVDGERGEAISWEMEPRPDGGRRVRLVRAPLLASSRPFVARFVAVATGAPLAGAWALPRVRPLTLPATGERWSLRVASGFEVEVTEAAGLAWEKSAIAPRDDEASVRLDWSWTEEEGRARVVLRPRPEPASTLAVELVRLGRQRAKIDLYLISRGTVPPDPSGFTLDQGPVLDWDLDETRDARLTNGPSGPAGPERDAATTAVEAAVPPAVPSGAGPETRHRASTRLDWDGSGRLPLLRPPISSRSRVVVLVALAPDVLAIDRSRGLLRLDTTFALASIAPDLTRTDLDPGQERLGLAFELRDGAPTLDLATEALQPCGPGGVIVQARTTCGRPIPGRTDEVRLMTARTALMALPMGEAPLSLTLPRSARLLMVRVDGRPAEPRSSEGRLLLNVPPGTGLNPSRQVLIDWEVETPPGSALPPPILLDWPTIDPAIRAALGPDERLDLAGPGWAAMAPSEPAWPSFLASLRELAPVWGLDNAVATRGEATATGPTVDGSGPARRGVRAATSAAETLGGALLKRDAGRFPLVIDRLAMESLGLNARTPTGSSSANPARSLGLVEERLGDVVVLRAASTPIDRDQPDVGGLTDWAREAAVTGSSPTGRFLSVSRWLAEPEASSTRDEVVAVARGASASRAGSSWLVPIGTGTGGEAMREPVRVRSGFPSRMRAVGLVLVIVVGAGLGRHARAWPRLIALAMVLIAAIPLTLVAATEAAGVLLGASLGAALWLGAAARRSVSRARTSPKLRTIRGRRRPVSGTAVMFAVALPLLASPDAPAQPRPVAAAPELRIVVISVSGEPGRVYLKREDHDALRDLAAIAGQDRAAAAGLLTARSGIHRVSMEEPGDDGIVVESRYELMLEGGDGPAFWPVPTGPAVDFVTTLDGVSVPLEMDARGEIGRVWARGRGPHALVVRRNFPAAPADAETPWSVPVSRTPETLVLGAAAMAENDRLAIDGETSPKAATSTPGRLRLGPVDQLVLTLSGPTGKEGTAAGAGSRPLIDGLMLWEAQAAGDLVRVRWNVRCAGSVSQLRVELSPGAVVRSASLPGLVDARLTPGQSSSIWTARLDPPWTGTQPVQLEVWVPASSSSGEGRDRPSPRVTPLDVEGHSGMMGLRRPGTWSGRLDATSGTGLEFVGDEVFARAWGAFPEPPATFAGAIRFGSSASASSVRAAIGPVAPSASVQTRLALRTRPGRVDVQAELLLTERDGRLRELVLRVPPGLRVDRVQGDGVEVWCRPAPDRLVLRLNGVEAGSRSVLLSGWQSVPGRPMSRSSGRDRLSVPWPRPDGLAESAIQVSVRARRGAQVELSPRAEAPALGPVPGPADPATPAAASDESITHYAWTPRPDDAPMLSWLPESSSIGPNVDVVSVLTVHPTQVRWRARLVSEGGPGPLPALSFSLPKDWAGPVTVRASGVDATFRQVDLDGQTLFTMVPSRPIWGRVAIDLDATRDWSPLTGLSFPELVPRGPGTATTTFAVANATGGDLVTQGEGIAAILLDTDLPFPFALPASLRSGYRVTRAGGSLSLRGPGPRPSPEMARVLSADLDVRADATRATLGSARVRLLDQPASFLEFLAPRGLEPLAALVDLRPVRPLRARDGRLLIPLDVPHAAVVELTFRTPSQDATSTTVPPSPILLPSAGAGVPHRIEIDRPDLAVASVVSSPDGLQTASAFDLEFARASDLRRGLLDRLRGFDRSQPSQRVSALEGMIRFEAQARSAERALAASAATDPRRAELRALQVDFRSELSGLGLADLATSAASRTGDDVEDPLTALEPEMAATVSFPIRPIGAVHRLHGEGPGGRPIAVEIARPTMARTAWPFLDLAPTLVLGGAVLLVAALGLLTRSRLLAGVAAVLIASGLTWVAPAFLIAAAAAVLFGALARTPCPPIPVRAAMARRSP
jgi:hypothetical protein